MGTSTGTNMANNINTDIEQIEHALVKFRLTSPAIF